MEPMLDFQTWVYIALAFILILQVGTVLLVILVYNFVETAAHPCLIIPTEEELF